MGWSVAYVDSSRGLEFTGRTVIAQKRIAVKIFAVKLITTRDEEASTKIRNVEKLEFY